MCVQYYDFIKVYRRNPRIFKLNFCNLAYALVA